MDGGDPSLVGSLSARPWSVGVAKDAAARARTKAAVYVPTLLPNVGFSRELTDRVT